MTWSIDRLNLNAFDLNALDAENTGLAGNRDYNILIPRSILIDAMDAATQQLNGGCLPHWASVLKPHVSAQLIQGRLPIGTSVLRPHCTAR